MSQEKRLLEITIFDKEEWIKKWEEQTTSRLHVLFELSLTWKSYLQQAFQIKHDMVSCLFFSFKWHVCYFILNTP